MSTTEIKALIYRNRDGELRARVEVDGVQYRDLNYWQTVDRLLRPLYEAERAPYKAPQWAPGKPQDPSKADNATGTPISDN